MQTMMLFDAFSIAYPDDLKLMSKEELDRFFGCNTNRYGFLHTDKHIVLTWTRQKGILAMLTDTKSVVNGAYHKMKRNLPEFEKLENTQRMIAGQNAVGYRFCFKAKNVAVYQTGDVAVFKYKGSIYACAFYTHDNLYDENHVIYDDILRSVQP